MGTLAPSPFLSVKMKPSVFTDRRTSLFPYGGRTAKKKNCSPITPVMRLFGPAIFEASKLKVLFVGSEEEKKKQHPAKLPRTYTLTHSDITSKLTLGISQTINNSQLQGWYNKLQRDEVVAEWRKVKGKMSLHVHCHISGGHFLLDLCARLRYYIFCKELPVVLKAFVHGDQDLFDNYPELLDATVWVYFHSNVAEFNKVECWGLLKEAMEKKRHKANNEEETMTTVSPEKPCEEPCSCCFPPMSTIPWARDNPLANFEGTNHDQENNLQRNPSL